MADFNPNIDKITERELVPDIYERTTTGKALKDLDDDTKTFFEASTKLSDINSKTIASLPTLISTDIDKMHTVSININTSDRLYNITASAPESSNDTGVNIVLARAYLERASVDVTPLLKIEGADYRSVTYSIKFDTSFENEDILKVYYYFRG